jgi:hypothetical protein
LSRLWNTREFLNATTDQAKGPAAYANVTCTTMLEHDTEQHNAATDLSTTIAAKVVTSVEMQVQLPSKGMRLAVYEAATHLVHVC